MAKMTKKIIGKMTVKPDDTITVTDPCYDADVWRRMDGVKIRPGEYTAAVWFHKTPYEYINGTKGFDTRVGTLGIYLNGVVPAQKNMQEIAEIGVDAGLCGIFTDKPDYTPEQWDSFCHQISNNDYLVMNDELGHGVVSRSGYGDGGYPVLAYKDASGEIIALEVSFI